jgi:hypothetical protein
LAIWPNSSEPPFSRRIHGFLEYGKLKRIAEGGPVAARQLFWRLLPPQAVNLAECLD